MKGSFQESLSSSDVQTPERVEVVRPEIYEPTAPLDVLKKKLDEIFHVESSDGTVFEGAVLEESPPIKPQYVTLDDGTTIELPMRENVENLTRTDDNGDIYYQDGKLLPNTTYVLNGNICTTDEYGNIVRVESKPKLSPDNARDVAAQKEAGGEDRRPTDQGGHIVSRELGGDSGPGNLVAMDSKINQSDYKRKDTETKEALEAGKRVSEVTEATYPDGSGRPDTITSTVTIDGKKTVYKFDNNMDGRLNDEVPESGKKYVQEKLKETGGVVSSIKEEYDENGEWTGTIVTITYTDENGKNHRKYVDC